MAIETLSFQAEVGKLLDIVAHSLYSDREIFLRELISNASDACDKLRYAGLTQPELLEGGSTFQVKVTPDKEAKTLTIEDNGIGMNRADLIETLGTIARSGTANFVSQLSGDSKKDVSLIGQFGVGFYSAFMVSDHVDVITRKAGETEGWRWSSDGRGEFTLAEEAKESRGTRIVLHIKKDAEEFLEPLRLRTIIKTYSDHIGLPVLLVDGDKEETANSASALWTRSKSEITPENYKEFYHHIAHAMDDPWLTLHYRAEGQLEYTGLLYIPGAKPFDLFRPERRQHVRLYVKRIFITDDCAELLPPYLRFLRGVVDSQDLPLNISREMLQKNPVLDKIRVGLVKRVLSELKKKAGDAEGNYESFWDNFGAVLKEGLYEDYERRDELLELCRFRSTAVEGWTSLADYVGRMKEGQDSIFTIAGDDPKVLLTSPQLEGFRAKGIEVLLLTDPIDEFWPGAVGAYQEKAFCSVASASADLSKVKAADQPDKAEPEAAPSEEIATLIAAFKLALGDKVKDVKASERLTESPVCLVTDSGDLSIHLERLLRQHQGASDSAKRILEINPKHPLIRQLAAKSTKKGGGEKVADSAWLLFDQALIVEGEAPSDPANFARRLSAMLEQAR